MKGIYILDIYVSDKSTVLVGSLGSMAFEKGHYAYVGSSQNNLEKRIQRHLSDKKKLHWHIDYLLKNPISKVVGVLYSNKGKSEECKIARKIASSSKEIAGFGCSDCNCTSHLFKIKANAMCCLGMKQFEGDKK